MVEIFVEFWAIKCSTCRTMRSEGCEKVKNLSKTAKELQKISVNFPTTHVASNFKQYKIQLINFLQGNQVRKGEIKSFCTFLGV